MSTATESPQGRRIVLVVGVDLTDVSEHLLMTTQDLVRSASEAQIHVVHVVAPEPLSLRLEEPRGSVGIADRSHIESAQFELHRLRDRLMRSANVRVVMHTPVGGAARELVRIARQVDADVIVVEAHEPKGLPRPLHRSLVGRIAGSAPCSVLAIRRRGSSAPQEARPAPSA
jgi:nucleotide-binding universal stress UspA family protein